LEDILQLWGPEDITKEDIRTGLQRWNIKFTEDDLNNVFNRLRFPGN